MTKSELRMVLHRPVLPPVEEGGDQADGEAGEEKVEAECSVDLLVVCWQEVRKEEVYDSFENARKRRTQMTDSVDDADVDPSGDNEEGVEIVSPALRVGVEVGRSC